jgi:guanylate kinase
MFMANPSYQERGLLIVVSGPSGVGKGTVCGMLRKRNPELIYSVSATTRSPRQGEKHGVNYFFHTRDEFHSMIENGQLIEWAEYVGNYYGTPRQFVEDKLNAGENVILEIEVQGAKQVKEQFPEGIFIFLLPPSMDELKRRIMGRGTENVSTIQRRLHVASSECKELTMYDYAVINDHLESACEKIEAILIAEHCHTSRVIFDDDM